LMLIMDVVAEIEDVEKQRMWAKTQKIIDHAINCFINRQLIYNLPEETLKDPVSMSTEHADFDGIELLALVLGGEIILIKLNSVIVMLLRKE